MESHLQGIKDFYFCGSNWPELRFKQCTNRSRSYFIFEFTTSAITSFYGHLPHSHWRMASIVSHTAVVLVNRVLSDGPGNWPRVRRHNLSQDPLMEWYIYPQQCTSHRI